MTSYFFLVSHLAMPYSIGIIILFGWQHCRQRHYTITKWSFVNMSSVSDEKNHQFSTERKIRFKPGKVLFNDNKIDDILKNEKSDIQHDESEHTKRG